MATAAGKSFSCNEHILKVLNKVKCPQNKRPRNRKCCHENTCCKNCQESNHIQVLMPLNLHSYIYMQTFNEISQAIFSILYTILYTK